MVNYRFPRESRLLTPGEFKQVFAKPVRAPSPQLTLLARPNALDHPRLGLAVPKKHVKQAVQRNQIKRIVRDSFRLKQHELPAVDIVVVAKAGVGQLSNAELHALIEKLWGKLCRRCKS